MICVFEGLVFGNGVGLRDSWWENWDVFGFDIVGLFWDFCLFNF
jgi:hypothetical protein